MIITQVDSKFTKYFIFAVLMHISLIIISYAFNSFNFDFFSKSIDQTIIVKEAVRVDVVGMPKYTIQELKNMINKNGQNDIAAKSQISKIDDPSAFKKKLKKVNALDLLKNYANQNNSKKNNKRLQKNNSKDGNVDFSNLIIEGNKVSKGTSLIGELSDENLKSYESYAISLPRIVRVNWKLPSYLMDEDLSCKIKIFINSRGSLIKAEFVTKSSSSEFNLRAMNSIKKVKSFPLPDADTSSYLSNRGVILAFPL